MDGQIKLLVAQDRACVIPSDRQVLAIIGLQTENNFRPRSFKGSELALVMDCSGSMVSAIDPDGNQSVLKLDKAIEGMWAAIDLLGPEDVFSVIGFDSKAQVVIDRIGGRDKEALLRDGKSEIEQRLRSQFGGRTNIHDGLQLGRSRLGNSRSNTIQRMILLSDGAANEPGRNATRLAIQSAEEISQEGIMIDVLGYGYGADMLPDLRSAIAKPSGGKWVHVNQPPTEIFQEQLKSAGKTFASGVVLALTFPTDVQVKDVYRTEPVITYMGEAPLSAQERTLYLRANQLEFGKDYTWMIEMDAPSNIQAETKLLDAKLSYRLVNGETFTEQGMISIKACANETEIARRDRQYVLLIEQARLNKLEKELSTAMAEKNKTKMVAVLNQMIERCRDIGLNSQVSTYQRILESFHQDHNFPKAALEAASTSTSVARKPSDIIKRRTQHRVRRSVSR